MRKNLFILFCLALCLLTGCSRGRQKSDTIMIWHWMTDRNQAFESLAEQYHQETGIKVKFELYAPSDVYSQKIIAAAQARILPDIFGILDKKSIVAEFIKSGFVDDLTPDFKADDAAWEKRMLPGALAGSRFDEGNPYGIKPGLYGVPFDLMNIQMLYNKTLLKKAGIKNPPKTFEEFLEAARALKRVGIPVFVSGWGELWMADCFASNYAFNIMGEEKVMATFRGEVPYTDPDWVRVFSVFEMLRENNALIEGIVTKANKYAEQDFALGRVAFAFNGSWCVNVYHDMNPDLEYGVMLPPSFGNRFPMRIWGGANFFMVNARSFHRDGAIRFLKWLTASEQQTFLLRETNNLPANQEVLKSLPPVLSEFAAAMDHTTHPTIWPRNEDSMVIEKFDKGIQSIIIGEKTPAQVAAEVQKVKEFRMEREARRQKKK